MGEVEEQESAQTTDPSLVKLEFAIRRSVLKKKGDPDAWITQPEDMKIQLEEIARFYDGR